MALRKPYDVKINGYPYVFDDAWASAQGATAFGWRDENSCLPNDSGSVYEYVLNCRDNVLDPTDFEQRYSAKDLIDNLVAITGRNVSFVDRLGGTFTGRIEDVNLHGVRVGEEDESDYGGTVVVRVRWLNILVDTVINGVKFVADHAWAAAQGVSAYTILDTDDAAVESIKRYRLYLNCREPVTDGATTWTPDEQIAALRGAVGLSLSITCAPMSATSFVGRVTRVDVYQGHYRASTPALGAGTAVVEIRVVADRTYDVSIDGQPFHFDEVWASEHGNKSAETHRREMDDTGVADYHEYVLNLRDPDILADTPTDLIAWLVALDHTAVPITPRIGVHYHGRLVSVEINHCELTAEAATATVVFREVATDTQPGDVWLNSVAFAADRAWAAEHNTAAMMLIEDEAELEVRRPDPELGLYVAREKSDWCLQGYRDWQAGAGQRSLDHAGALTNRFYSSEAIDIATRGRIKLAPSLDEVETVANRTPTGVCCEGHSYQWAVWREAGGTDNLYFRSTGNWTVAPGVAHPTTGQITAVICDGDYIYAAFTGAGAADGIYKGRSLTAFVKVSDVENVTKMAVCMGHLCLARDYVTGETVNGSSAGYLDFTAEPNRAYVPCTPTTANIWMPNVDTKAFCVLDTHVYWMIASGQETAIYRFNPIAVGYDFAEVARFKEGFLGEAMEGYLGRLFVGGYLRTANAVDNAISASGIGVLYGVLPSDNSYERLVRLGENESEDNRIMALAAHGDYIYMIAGAGLWRYDVTTGSYAHLGALASGVAATYWSDVPAWTATWDGSAEPAAPWAFTKSTSPDGTPTLDFAGNRMNVKVANNGWAMWKRDSVGMVADCMMETAIYGAVSDGGEFGLANDEALLRISVTKPAYMLGVIHLWVYRGGIPYPVGAYPSGSAIGTTVRLVLDDTLDRGYVYVNGFKKVTIPYSQLPLATVMGAAMESCIYLSCGSTRGDQSSEGEEITYDYASFHATTIVLPPPVSYTGVTCALLASLSGIYSLISGDSVYALARTNQQSYATSGEVVTSESSMGTELLKHLRYIDVVHDFVGSGETIWVTPIIDGIEREPYEIDSTETSRRTQLELSTLEEDGEVVNSIEAYTVALKIGLEGPGDGTPEVISATVRGTVESVRRYQYVLSCLDTLGFYSPSQLIDHLKSISGRAIDVSANLGGTYVGKIERIEIHEARSATYAGVAVVRIREL